MPEEVVESNDVIQPKLELSLLSQFRPSALRGAIGGSGSGLEEEGKEEVAGVTNLAVGWTHERVGKIALFSTVGIVSVRDEFSIS